WALPAGSPRPRPHRLRRSRGAGPRARPPLPPARGLVRMTRCVVLLVAVDGRRPAPGPPLGASALDDPRVGAVEIDVALLHRATGQDSADVELGVGPERRGHEVIGLERVEVAAAELLDAVVRRVDARVLLDDRAVAEDSAEVELRADVDAEVGQATVLDREVVVAAAVSLVVIAGVCEPGPGDGQGQRECTDGDGATGGDGGGLRL